MAYIGNSIQTQGFTPAIDYFSGNGSTVTFTLSRPVASVAQIICAIDNVIQNPSSAYTVSGSSITFTSAPLSGTNNIWVEYTSLITTYAALSQSPSVVGDITASGGYLAVGNFGASFIDGTIVDYTTGNGRITVGPADGFTIYTGGTSARTALTTWDSSGNVGIGTTSPLSLSGYGSLTLSGSTGGITTYRVSGTDTGYVFANSSEFAFKGTTAGPATFYTNNTERMRITSAGVTLIGTTNTDVGGSVSGIRLNQTGDIISCIDGSGLLHYQSPIAADRRNTAGDGVMYGMWRAGIYQCGIGATNGSTMTFFTGNNASQTERMRIDSSGNLLVNATSATGHKMTVQSAAGAGGIDCVGGATNGYYAMRVDMPSTNTYGVLFRNNGNNVGDIRINSSTTTYNTSSDYRLKEDIAPMTGALNKVSALKPVTYKWKLTGEESQGFIAHELQAVVPDCVTGEKDAVDEDGNPQYQGIDTSFLVATLTAAIQEQQAMIEELKTKVAALEAK